MPSPNAAITRFDLSLTYAEFSVLANQRKFIGLKVMPAVGVARASSSFLRLNVEAVLGKIEDTKRAPGAAYRRGDYEWATDNYSTDEHGVEEMLDKRTLEMYGSEIRLERLRSLRAVARVLRAFENDVATAVFNTTTWTGSALTTAIGGGLDWSTPAAGLPITDIDAAVEKVKTSSGMRPNTLIITDFALRKLKRTAQVQDLLKYSGRDDPKDLTPGLADLLDLERIIVADGFKNTADDGQSVVFAGIWDSTMAMVAHINTGDDLEDPDPTIGRTIMFNESNANIPGGDDGAISVIVEEYEEPQTRSTVLRARNDRQVKILHPEAGHLLTAVTA